MSPGVRLIAALLLGVAVAACDSDPPPPMGSAPTYEPRSHAGAMLGHRLDASVHAATFVPSAIASTPAPGALVPPPTTPSQDEIASKPMISASAAAAKSAPPPVSAACGDKPLPPCPLGAWMKANATPAITGQNFEALASVLDKTAAFAPKDYPNWASIAQDGADAARAQNLDAVKASCRSCHNQYRWHYKTEMRGRPLPL